MKRARFLSTILLSLLFALGCSGKSGGSDGDDVQDACDDAAAKVDSCTDVGGFSISCAGGDAGDVSGACEDASTDYFNCIADLSCAAIAAGATGCGDEAAEVARECDAR